MTYYFIKFIILSKSKDICYISWPQWVWKTTLGNKLQETWNCFHIDTDIELSKLTQDSEKFFRYLMKSLPKGFIDELKKAPNPIELFLDLAKQWYFDSFLHTIIWEMTLKNAIRIRKKSKKNVVITWNLINKESRKYFYDLLMGNWIEPILIYISWSVNDILSVLSDREESNFQHWVNVSSLWLDELQLSLKSEIPYTEDEWWTYLELNREKLLWDISKLEDLQFLIK